MSETLNKYICIHCNFETNKKYNYDIHLESNKHFNNTNFQCTDCGKFYKFKSNLSRHRKNCIYNDQSNSMSDFENIINEKIDALESSVNKEIVSVVTSVMEANDKFQQQIINSNIQLQSNITQTNIKLIESNNQFVKTIAENNNSVLENVVNLCNEKMSSARSFNSKFNLTNYLNNTCKDAPNIEDFVNEISPTYEDVVCVGKCGYVEGNAEVIMKYLKNMDQTKRPIQCSDPKRYTVYLKSGGKWEKDDDGLPKTSHIVNRVCNKTYRNKKLWIDKHPNCQDADNKSGVEYILLVKAISGGGADIDLQNQNISKKIAKECVVKK